jgi:transposase-like protein
MKTNSLFNQQELQIHYRYFSEDFKKKRVKELENNLVTISDLCKTYHVSRTSVYRWIYKFSAMAKRQNKQVVEVKSDTRKIQLLEQRIKELERIVGQKQILLEFKDKMIEIAEQTYDVDIKKKLGSKLSAGINSSEEKSTHTL